MGLWNNLKNFTVVKRDDYQEAKKGLEDLKTIANYSRPQDMSAQTPNMTLASFSTMITPVDLYQMSKFSDVLRNVIPTIRNEIFRNGIDCEAISTEPSEYQKEKIDKILKKANHNRQTLKDVLMEFEDDLQIIDNGYLLALKTYYINEDNDIVGAMIDEILRVDPLLVTKVMDQKARLGYDEKGNAVYFSLDNRSEITYKKRDAKGRENLRACYCVKTGDAKGDVVYYDANEMLHVSKYNPSKTYGLSQLYSLHNKIMTLINQDYYIRQYYSGNKVPKGLFTVNTTNSTSFKAMWNDFLNKIRNDPHGIHPVINQTQDPSKQSMQFINFMNNLQEMQYTEGRNEIRQSIGSLFYVSPVFQNDVSTSGGLNNEGLQITVTNRGSELGQSIYNEKVFPFIFEENMGITDYEVKLKPSDEIDEVTDKDLRLKEIEIARKTAELGISVRMEEDGTFTYESGEVELQDPQQEPEPQPQPQQVQFSEDTTKNYEPVKKAEKKVPKKERKEFRTALEKELDEIIKKLDLSTKPSEQELNDIVAEVSKNLNKRLNAKSANYIKAIYNKAKKTAEKEVGQEMPMDSKDRNVIEALKRDPNYRESFSGVSEKMSERLKETIQQAYEKPQEFTMDKLVGKMKDELGKSSSELRRIARTETSKVSIAARKTQYEKTGFTYKYKWIGPSDARTGQDSKNIKKRTKDGVSWDELVKIIQEEAGSDWKVDKVAPIPRPNTRHTFIAERVEE